MGSRLMSKLKEAIPAIVPISLAVGMFIFCEVGARQATNINMLYAQQSHDKSQLPNFGDGHFPELYRRLEYLNNPGINPPSSIINFQRKFDNLFYRIPYFSKIFKD